MADPFGSYDTKGAPEDGAGTINHAVSHDPPQDIRMRDFSGYPDDLVMRYGLDNSGPMPAQRMVWLPDPETEPDSDYDD